MNEIKTAPYKWMGEFYARLAAAHGCTHERQYIQIPGKFNDSRTGGAYHQIISGSDKAEALVERLADQTLAQLEVIVRSEFPGPQMFAKGAAARREQLIAALDVSKLREGAEAWAPKTK